MKQLRSGRTILAIAVIAVLVLTLGFAASAIARGKGNGNTTTAVVSGPMSTVHLKIVSLQTQAPVAGAHVRLSNDATGYNMSSTTNGEGVATFYSVPYYFNYASDLSAAGFVSSIRLVNVDESEEFLTQALIQK